MGRLSVKMIKHAALYVNGQRVLVMCLVMQIWFEVSQVW